MNIKIIPLTNGLITQTWDRDGHAGMFPKKIESLVEAPLSFW